MLPNNERKQALLLLRKWTFLLPPVALVLVWKQPVLGWATRIFGSAFIVLVTSIYTALACTILVRYDLLKLEWRGGSLPSLTTKPTQPDFDALEHHRSAQKLSPPTRLNTASSSAGSPSPASTATAWTGFRGPNRDGVYHGPIHTNWASSPPSILWKQPVGGGYSSFAMAEGLAFTLEQRRKEEAITAYDIESGKEVWSQLHYGLFEESLGGNGPRSTPVFQDGRLYTLGALGTLQCLNARDGHRLWSTNILIDSHASLPTYGCSSSPLVVGEAVITTPGGTRGGAIAAYHGRTTQKLWSVLDDEAAYSSPMLARLLGREQILVVTDKRIVALKPDNGKLLWDHPWQVKMDNRNIAQPVVVGSNQVFLSAGYGTGSELLTLTLSNEVFTARTEWKNLAMKNKFSSSVLHQGHLYGLDEDRLACVEIATGRRLWKEGHYGYGQLLLAGDHLILLTGDGDLALVQARPDQFVEIARVPVLKGKTWNHPSIQNGLLLVRNAAEMACVDLRP